MSRIKYSDLVDVSKLQALMESFSAVIGIANAVIDVEGNVIVHAGWQDACTGFHRVSKDSCRRCIESDTSLVESMTQGKPYAVYRCLNGLVDTAAPIVVAGEHVANVFTGQFLTEPPDFEAFRQQAREFGFDESSYLAAIAKVPIVPADRVESLTRLYAQLAAMLADSGMDRINQQNAADKLADANKSLEETVSARTQDLLRANEYLLQQQALLKGILDTASVAIFLIDNEALITRANERMARMFGCTLDELVGREYFSLVHPAQRESARKNLLHIIDKGIPSLDLERRYVRADQSEFWGHVTARILRDANDVSVGLVAVIADITARKAVEETLHQSEERLRLALDAANQAWFDVDLRTGNVTVSPEYPRMIGYEPDDFQSDLRNWMEHVHPDDREALNTTFRACVEDGGPYSMEYRRQTRSGEWKWIQSIGKIAQRDAQRKATRMIGIHTDITERKQAEEALRDSEARFHRMFEHNDSVMLLIEPDSGCIVDANAAAARFYGYSIERLKAMTIDRINMLSPDEVNAARAQAARHERNFFVFPHRLADGQVRTVETRSSPIQVGNRSLLFSIVHDITERKRMEKALEESEFRWKFAIEGSGDGVWDWNIETDAVTYSKRWKEMLGYAENDILPTNEEWVKRIHPDDHSYVAQAMQNYLDGKTPSYTVEYRLKCKDESYKWILGRGMVVSRREDGRPTRMIGTHTDITEHKQMEEQIRYLAFFDPLTRLPNRRLLNDRLKQTVAASKRNHCHGALMFLDLDNFKPLNDAHGHEVGDLLLIEASDRLRSCVREMDTVARFGGDEFVVMISELDEDKAESIAQAAIIAEKIRSKLSEPYRLTVKRTARPDTEIEHHCTTSIGVALFIDHEASQDDILRWADAAMYKAKEAGRNSIRFYESDD